jgi:hypothetical protein
VLCPVKPNIRRASGYLVSETNVVNQHPLAAIDQQIKKEIMMLSFDNKAVLITGAGNGLGHACAKFLISQDASFVVGDLGGDNGSGPVRA